MKDLQQTILAELRNAERPMFAKDLLKRCYPGVTRKKNKSAYQSAWAALSRCLRRMELQGKITRFVRIIQGDVRFWVK